MTVEPSNAAPVRTAMSRTPGAPRGGGVALAVLALIWGYNWVVVKVALRDVQPFTFATLRNLLSAVVLFGLLAVLRRPLRPPAFLLTLLLGLLQTTGFVGLSTWALEHEGAGKTAILTYTMPFWLLLLAWVFLGERLRRPQWPAIALAFTGLMLVLEPWRLDGSWGGALAVAGGLCWAGSAVVAKVLHQRHDTDLLSVTTWQMLLGSLPLLVIAGLTYESSPEWTSALVGALAFNVVAANAIGWFLWLYVLRVLAAGTAGIGTLAIPVVGVLAAWIQLGERPGAVEAVGMVLILAALALITAVELAAGRRARLLAVPQE
jgi:drug/metabolite transporter (DMT)-like permease